ncbi:hypothetical protein KA005_85855 [bacterium]|nr:hypothetical protein [bacterium]
MAGILKSLLPSLLSGSGGGGILSGIKDFAGSVLSDLGSGKVMSGGDFGRSLARAGSRALGASPADKIDSAVARGSIGKFKNGADLDIIVQPEEPQIHSLRQKDRGSSQIGNGGGKVAEDRQGPGPSASPKIDTLKMERIRDKKRTKKKHRKSKK